MRDIARVAKPNLQLRNLSLLLRYFSYPGATTEKFLTQPDWLKDLIAYNPCVIILIVGGNDFYNNVSNQTIYDNYQKLVAYLKEKLPTVSLIPCQIEKRFLATENRWNSADTELFEKRRSAYNRKLNKCLHKFCTLRVQGSGRLDDRSNYARDGIHLSAEGVSLYWKFIVSTLDYYLSLV